MKGVVFSILFLLFLLNVGHSPKFIGQGNRFDKITLLADGLADDLFDAFFLLLEQFLYFYLNLVVVLHQMITLVPQILKCESLNIHTFVHNHIQNLIE